MENHKDKSDPHRGIKDKIEPSGENEQEEALYNSGKKSKKFWIFLLFIFVPLAIILLVVAYGAIVNYYGFEENKILERLDRLSMNLFDSRSGGDVPEPNPNQARRLLDGTYVKTGQENKAPIAVVLDNHPDALPLAGIADAQLVIEAPVEGGITRYLAFFSGHESVGQIGPVRSARPYFIDWVNEFSACFSHCGGSPEALVKIVQEDIVDMNEFYHGDYYWRAEDRKGPHNVMTSLSNLRSFAEEKGLSEGKYFSWLYKTDKQAASRPASTTAVTIPEYGVVWAYDYDRNDYVRHLRGRKHTDALGLAVRAKNVILQYTDMEVIDELLRMKIRTVGEGEAIVCLDGQCREGKWRKKSASSRTRFFNEMGEEFKFNAGTTWVEIVEGGFEISY